MKRVLLLAGAAACAAPQPPVVERAAPPPVAERPAPRPAPCRLTGSWGHDQPRALQFRPDGKTFATAYQAKHAALALGEHSAFVELSLGDVELRGFVPPDAVVLHAARPLLLSGYAAPGPTAILRWRGGTHDKVWFDLALPAFVVGRATIHATGACDDLSLESTNAFDPRAAIAAAPGTTQMLAEEELIELSTTADGPAVAQLTFATGATPLVDVVARDGTEARVVIPVTTGVPDDDIVLVGWVSASAIRPHSGGTGGSWGVGGGAGPRRPRSRPDARRVRCAQPVPLTAELDGERHVVGTIAQDVIIDVLPTDGSDVEVMIRSAPVELESSARFLVARRDVDDCAAVTLPP